MRRVAAGKIFSGNRGKASGTKISFPKCLFGRDFTGLEVKVFFYDLPGVHRISLSAYFAKKSIARDGFEPSIYGL